MQTRAEVSTLLTEAASRIHAETDPRLIPDHGIILGCALPGATTVSDVCAVNCATPSAVRWGGDADADPNPDPNPNTDPGPDIARVILTVIRHDPALRTAVAVRCTEDVLQCATDDCAFDVVCYPTAPPGSGTMDWGIESACRDGVPDGIYGQKTSAGDTVLWIFAETPADGARNLIMLSGCISYTS